MHFVGNQRAKPAENYRENISGEYRGALHDRSPAILRLSPLIV